MASIPPPGWQPTATALAPREAPAPAQPSVHAGAEAAVRWRIGAAVIDNLIVYGGYLLVCLVLHWQVRAPSHLLVLLAAGVLYHFALEARDGQTIGKRRYGIRVVSVDGGPASTGAVAIRSVLRLIDQLPVSYVSGLVSMLRTGPRRQRIGDVAARTTVLPVGGRALARGTPGWLLPAATIFAVLVSAVSAFALFDVGNRPLSSSQEAQFLDGCNRTGGAVVDCRCVLTQIEAAGYDTPNEFQQLYVEERQAILTRNPAATPHAIVLAARSCRR